MHHTIVYSIIVLVVLFIIIYINKHFYLEGYSYIPNLHFTNPTDMPIISPDDILLSTCEKSCNAYPTCTGFTSLAPNGSKNRTKCTYYTNKTLDKNNLKNVTYGGQNINLYIK